MIARWWGLESRNIGDVVVTAVSPLFLSLPLSLSRSSCSNRRRRSCLRVLFLLPRCASLRGCGLMNGRFSILFHPLSLHVILPRNRPGDRSRLPARLHHPSRDPPPRELVRLFFLLREHVARGIVRTTWPVCLARSTSIIVKEVPRRERGSAGCSHLSLLACAYDTLVTVARISLFKVATRRNNPLRRAPFALTDLVSITKLTRIPSSREFRLLRWENCDLGNEGIGYFLAYVFPSSRWSQSTLQPADSRGVCRRTTERFL